MDEKLKGALKKLNKRVKEKKPLSPSEVKILRALFHTRLPLSQYEIAKKADLSWGTVKKHAPKLKAKKLVLSKPNKQLSFNFDLFLGEKKKKKRKI